MVSPAQLSGYLLEEVVAHLLQTNGYRLLSASDDTGALIRRGNGLRVRGRGAEHQADALGDLDIAIPFSLPIRLFVEAKNTGEKAGLEVVRNAHGIVHDVNEFTRADGWQAGVLTLVRRVQYRYSIFSTAGFTGDAQDFALAHQISLIDLSGSSWAALADRLRRAAAEVIDLLGGADVSAVARNALRDALRAAEPPSLHEASVDDDPAPEPVADWAASLARTILRSPPGSEDLLLGFVDAPFVLALRPDDTDAFRRYVRRRDVLNVRISYADTPFGGDWVVQDVANPDAFSLAFALPGVLEGLLLAAPPEHVRRAASVAKGSWLSTITVYVDGAPIRMRYTRLPVPPGESRAEDAGDATALRSAARRPSDQLRRVVEMEEPGSEPTAPWPQDQVLEFIHRLEREAPGQARLVRWAADHDGRISRSRVYEVARLDRDRTLRGLTRPCNRLRAEMIREGLLDSAAKYPFEPVYQRGSKASHFRVPDEFVAFLRDVASP